MMVPLFLLGMVIFVVIMGSSEEDAKVLYYPREAMEKANAEIRKPKPARSTDDGEVLQEAPVASETPVKRTKITNSAAPKKSSKGAAALAKDIYNDLD